MSTPALPSMQESVRQFARALRSERTAKTYASIVEAFLRFVENEHAPRPADVERFLERPLNSGKRASAATYNQTLSALRSYAKFAVKEGIWLRDPTAEVRFAPEEPKDPAVLFVPEVQDFVRAASIVSAPTERARDLAVLALAFTVGLRVSEMVALEISQVDLSTAALLNVVRKGRRVQTLPLGPKAVYLLRRWLDERGRTARAGELALFVSRRGTRFSVRSIERLFERIRKHLGLAKRATPHTARHSFVTNELLLGADITVVSRLAGHASITTTMRYRHLADVEPRKAVTALGILIPSELTPAEPDAPTPVPQLAARVETVHLSAPYASWTSELRPANDTLDDQENLGDIAPAA